MEWVYQGEPFTETPDAFGFIYAIYYEDDKMYYGKKQFYKTSKLAPLKSGEIRPGAERSYKLVKMNTKELQARTTAQKSSNVRNKQVFFDRITKPSNWRKYEGSSEETKELTIVKKEILALSVSKRELTYLEVKCLFQMEALEDPNCLNISILGTFYKDNIN